MPGLVPAIHVFVAAIGKQDVDARHKAGHDEECTAVILRCERGTREPRRMGRSSFEGRYATTSG
jgi:hypothetical protein